MKKCRIINFNGCRSDQALTELMVGKFRADPFFEAGYYSLDPRRYIDSFKVTEGYIAMFKPDIAFIVADRLEAMAAATACFLHQIPICHLYGGITNYPLSTVDDIFRHQISLMSEMIFVENAKAMVTVHALFYSIDKVSYAPPKIHNIGNLYMCDYEINCSLVPEGSYDLVLYNVYKKGSTTKDIKKIYELTKKNRIVVIEGNPDGKYNMNSLGEFKQSIIYNNTLRSQFLGLLQNCERFITNSSSAYYEAPHFLKPEQIILIGDRNKNRSSTNLSKGNPERIINIIKKWWRDRQ